MKCLIYALLISYYIFMLFMCWNAFCVLRFLIFFSYMLVRYCLRSYRWLVKIEFGLLRIFIVFSFSPIHVSLQLHIDRQCGFGCKDVYLVRRSVCFNVYFITLSAEVNKEMMHWTRYYPRLRDINTLQSQDSRNFIHLKMKSSFWKCPPDLQMEAEVTSRYNDVPIKHISL